MIANQTERRLHKESYGIKMHNIRIKGLAEDTDSNTTTLVSRVNDHFVIYIYMSDKTNVFSIFWKFLFTRTRRNVKNKTSFHPLAKTEVVIKTDLFALLN